MKHRHKLAHPHRHKTASRNRRSDADKTADEQPFSSAVNTKKRTAYHMKAEGGRTKHRLDKFRRGGRSRNRYDNGGPAGSTAGSTRSADDPGNELAEASKGRKGTLGRIQDELLGPKSAYKHGGRQKQRHFDDGGLVDDDDIASNAGGSSLGSSLGSGLSSFGNAISTVAKLQGSGPPPVPVPSSPAPQANNPSVINQLYGPQAKLAARVKALEAAGQQKSMFPGKPKTPGSKQGGRAEQREVGRRK
jgi:hypothetical protein